MTTEQVPPEADRDEIPVSLGWHYLHAAGVMDVTLGIEPYLPEIMIRLERRGSGIRAEGQFAPGGRMSRFSVEAMEPDREVNWVVLRQPAIGTLRKLAPYLWDVARQAVAGVPADKIVINGLPVEAALAKLMDASGPPRPRQRLRGQAREELLIEVARVYRAAADAGEKNVRRGLAESLHYSEKHIARLIKACREERNGRPPLLGPAIRGRVGEAELPGD